MVFLDWSRQQILWPDGIFITKHPNRQRPPQSVNQAQGPQHRPSDMSSPRKEDAQKENTLNDEQQREEAARRAKFVYELMIGKISHLAYWFDILHLIIVFF